MLAAVPHHLAAKFVVERRLGRGGAGVVYAARDLTIGRDVALKTLPAVRRGAVARLAEEARTMASLRHEGLATIYGLEIWREIPILVVEYFSEGTLARRLARGPLSPRETIDAGIALADTLAYLHRRGLLHRDVKPSNIALSTAGAPVLLDFGLATWSASEDIAIAGTPAYLPPEALRGDPPSPAFDLWALAVVLLECVSGTNPFAAETTDTTVQRVARLDLSTAMAPIYLRTPLLAETLDRALSRDPFLRFPTTVHFRRALEAARGT